MPSLVHESHGSGPSLVLLHGFPFHRGMWSAILPALAQRCRVVLPDLPGHGESPLPPERTNAMDDMADAVAALLDELGIEGPVVMGGLSMGGYVAQAFAVKFPERVGGLVLMDTKAAGDTPEAAANRETLAKKVEEAQGPRPAAEAMLPKLFAPETEATNPEAVRSVRSMIDSTSFESVAATLRGLAVRPDRTSALSGWPWPTLLIVGEHDALTPPDEMRKMAEALPDAQLVVVPGAGHLAPLERPEAVASAVLEFLDRCLSRAPFATPGI